MRKKIIIPILALTMFIACNQKPAAETTTTESTTSTPSNPAVTEWINLRQ